MRPFRFLLAPWWVVALATGAKGFADNPVLGSRRLNARGLHVARVRATQAMAAWRRRGLRRRVDPADAAAFDRDGFVRVDGFLPAAAFETLRAQAMNFAGHAREQVQGDAITRRIALDPEALAAMPAVRALLAGTRWRALLRYADASATEPLFYLQSILARRVEAAPDPQTVLHADTFHPTMKAWLFLTDVAEEDGPLTYVAGSHRMTPARLAWERARSLRGKDGLDPLSARGSLRIAEDELAALGLPPPTRFTVPANTLVVADTSGFHARGLASRPSVRVEIWAYGARRNPFLPWTGLDPLGLPGLAERRAGFYWALCDRFPRLLGRHWRDVGRKRPADA